MDTVIKIFEGAAFIAALVLLVCYHWQKDNQYRRSKNLGDGDIQTLRNPPNNNNKEP